MNTRLVVISGLIVISVISSIAFAGIVWNALTVPASVTVTIPTYYTLTTTPESTIPISFGSVDKNSTSGQVLLKIKNTHLEATLDSVKISALSLPVGYVLRINGTVAPVTIGIIENNMEKTVSLTLFVPPTATDGLKSFSIKIDPDY